MALEITGNIDLGNGITLPSCYGRTLYRVDLNSSNILISTTYWVNKSSYEQGIPSINPIFTFDGRYEYNRSVDGEDVLNFTQLKIKEKLEEIGLSVLITDI